ncbi:phage holin family protein [Actinobacteria bacterium YIM 96077]|uniref:Phage holin family protein n=1 Tax=Phytoactinopolyspora halophila TaxID=1981511 RepID=A0A329R0B1_9ACTN|nr:phage holin family protein [Phytoactinopolyspora halophila]AYY11772.1 phage holin family protein [Actinobacteria bacterium YIM 96077]RAW17793.1 phage holin family protein [Phytoactinopolyspora halophila]
MTTRSTPDDTEPSTGRLVVAIKEDLSGLIRDEIDLAKAELRADVRAAGLGAALIAVAGVLSVFALILLSIAVAYGLTGLGLAPGWAFLIVAGLYLLVALIAVLVARSRFGAISGSKRSKKAAQQAVQALRATSQT